MTIAVEITTLDRQVLDEMRLRGRYGSDGAVVRTALWHHARHFDIDVPPEVFAAEALQPSLFERGEV